MLKIIDFFGIELSNNYRGDCMKLIKRNFHIYPEQKYVTIGYMWYINIQTENIKILIN